jgi:hypothetical protein
MMIRPTHTFATLGLSNGAFNEIKSKLEAAGYGHAFIQQDDELVIDMHGIGVKKESSEPDEQA